MTDKSASPENNDPDWSLLPRNPVKFFSLPEDWSETDLKSAYSRLIRRFKPDRAPDEFQKIRRAYDDLKTRLEQGSSIAYTFQMSTSEESGEITNGSSGSWPNERWGFPQTSEALTIGIDPSEPDESFRQLLSKTHKTADDYIDLAILADIVSEELFPDRRTFETWLWDGLTAYPKSRPLMETLSSYYNDPSNHDDIDFDAAINRVASFRPHAVSDELISGLIFGVLKVKGVKTCLEIWDREFQPHASGEAAYLVALIELMPPALWFGEDVWVEKQKKFLESDNNWQKIDFEGLERILQVVLQARKPAGRNDHETPFVQQIREICGNALKYSSLARRELLLKSTDEIYGQREKILALKSSPTKANHGLIEFWEYLLLRSGVIRPVEGVNQGQILNFRKFLAEVSKDVPTWLWSGAKILTGVGLALVGIALFSVDLLLLISDDLYARNEPLVGMILFVTLIVILIAIYAFRAKITRRLGSLFWPLFERSYRPQRGRLLEFFDAQPMPARVCQILLEPSNITNLFPGVKTSVCDAILSDSDLLLLAVTTRAV